MTNSLLTHLKARHLDMYTHRVWLDEENGLATFPLYTLNGKIVGYQQYNPAVDKKQKNHPKECRYFTYVTSNQAVGNLVYLVCCQRNFYSIFRLFRVYTCCVSVYILSYKFCDCLLCLERKYEKCLTL